MLSDTDKWNIESSRDTGPLDPKQLSDAEIRHISEIEQRLKEARGIDYKVSSGAASRRQTRSSDKAHFANAEERFGRVLLLDGGRGTGKTSLLLTLVRKWHAEAGISEERWTDRESEHEGRLRSLLGGASGFNLDPVKFVRVIRILDFDPLPIGMPLLAGIVQAVRPLADLYDSPVTYTEDSCDDENKTLVELWHRLFRVAALGWSAIPQPKGLIEQLLDREEQVEDWLQMADNWKSFIGEVLDRGQCVQKPDRLPQDAVFVIMIDDVDLQVSRVQELLPALRLLYHPRVFFLVAADKLHMVDMLKLDFLGKQSNLAGQRGAQTNADLQVADEDRWASVLAESAFQKVFPKRNRWKLERLSLLDFLAFPRLVRDLPDLNPETGEPDPNWSAQSSKRSKDDKTFHDYLREIKPKTPSHTVLNQTAEPLASKNAGDLILQFARLAREIGLPGVMPYRTAAQLWQYVMGFSDGLEPTEVLALLLSPVDRPATSQPDNDTVDVPTTGELAALYRRGPTELAGTYNIVLSGRPDFVFHKPGDKRPTRMSTEPQTRFNFTVNLLAKTLEGDNFAVDAAALQWGNYLSLVWTEWPSLEASFVWTRHKYPSPYKLLQQNKTWSEFVSKRFEPSDKLEFYAYVWIYFQRRWGGWSNSLSLPDSLDPMNHEFVIEPLDWKTLLTFPESKSNKDTQECKDWKNLTLPLLARPELGLPTEVQKKLLAGIGADEEAVVKELYRQRRRLVTDAVYAAAMQHGEVLTKLPDDNKVEEMIKVIDQVYMEGHEQENPWQTLVENRNQKAVGQTGQGS